MKGSEFKALVDESFAASFRADTYSRLVLGTTTDGAYHVDATITDNSAVGLELQVRNPATGEFVDLGRQDLQTSVAPNNDNPHTLIMSDHASWKPETEAGEQGDVRSFPTVIGDLIVPRDISADMPLTIGGREIGPLQLDYSPVDTQQYKQYE